MAVREFDYIVIGAGSAGCVLADKLSQHDGATVLVLEAGGHDRRLWINMPIGYGKTFYDERVNWKFEAQSDAGLNQRRIYFPRGKVVGGSSSINAMVYCRGLPQDFDDWARAGNTGWSWQDILPIYDDLENRVDARRSTPPVAGRCSSATCATSCTRWSGIFTRPPNRPACRSPKISTGPRPKAWAATRSIPGAACAGRPPMPSCARPCAAARSTLQTGALVERILFEGRKAVGVSYRQGGAVHTARARAAVVLSAGAIQSPQLLQLSGVGPGDLLQRHGITPVLVQAAGRCQPAGPPGHELLLQGHRSRH